MAPFPTDEEIVIAAGIAFDKLDLSNLPEPEPESNISVT